MSEDVREFVPTQENIQADLKTMFRQAIYQVLTAALEAEVNQLVGAPRGKRASDRKDVRNGSYARTLLTTVGELEVDVPRTRHHGAAKGPLTRYARRTEEIDDMIVAAYVRGVSTRKVDGVTTALMGKGVSASTVSRVTKSLEDALTELANGKLTDEICYLYLDATFVKARVVGQNTKNNDRYLWLVQELLSPGSSADAEVSTPCDTRINATSGSRQEQFRMTTTRLEYRKGRSNKFWEIEVRGAATTIRYGRIGTGGREQEKAFATEPAASEAAMRLIVSKRQKGYLLAEERSPVKTQMAKAVRKAPAAESEAAPRRWDYRRPYISVLPHGDSVLVFQAKAIVALDVNTGREGKKIAWSPCGAPQVIAGDLLVPTAKGFDVYDVNTLSRRRSVIVAPARVEGAGPLTDRGLFRAWHKGVGYRLLESRMKSTGGPGGSYLLCDWVLQAFDVDNGQELFCNELGAATSDWISAELIPLANLVVVRMNIPRGKRTVLYFHAQTGVRVKAAASAPMQNREPKIRGARQEGSDRFVWTQGDLTLGMARTSRLPNVIRGWGRPEPAKYVVAALDKKTLKEKARIATLEAEGPVRAVFAAGRLTVVVQARVLSGFQLPV